ncbi:hypothetical protein [Thioclava sp. GXIMD4216]|uniref:hypothetical protein n=1 Tax=Thioclava sp. GXIMD4216 TaxID=3131929 RepID=UPI0030D61888
MTHSPAAPETASSGAQTLRDALRQRLTPAHDALDRAFSALDLGIDADYAVFLRAHRQALGRMQAATDTDPAPEQMAGSALIRRLLAALEADLAPFTGHALCGDAPQSQNTAPLRLHPLARDYVLFGSRLGTQVLARRRREALVQQGRDAVPSQYLEHVFDPRLWQNYVHQTSQISVENPQTESIIADAEQCFEWFALALSQHLSSPAAPMHPHRAEKAPL